MKSSTTEWVAKAEGDFRSAERIAEDPEPHWDLMCFEAQQAAEKYLKAVLVERDVYFPKVHDLVLLTTLFDPPEAVLTPLRERLSDLSLLAVLTRYPGYAADAAKARASLSTAAQVRKHCRELLGLD